MRVQMTSVLTKLGVGFTGFPLISVNLEYSMITYTKVNGAALTPNVVSIMYGITVSLPLDF